MWSICSSLCVWGVGGVVRGIRGGPFRGPLGGPLGDLGGDPGTWGIGVCTHVMHLYNATRMGRVYSKRIFGGMEMG